MWVAVGVCKLKFAIAPLSLSLTGSLRHITYHMPSLSSVTPPLPPATAHTSLLALVTDCVYVVNANIVLHYCITSQNVSTLRFGLNVSRAACSVWGFLR